MAAVSEFAAALQGRCRSGFLNVPKHLNKLSRPLMALKSPVGGMHRQSSMVLHSATHPIAGG